MHEPAFCRKVRRGFLPIKSDSLGGAKSDRPGVHPIWILMSDQTELDPKTGKQRLKNKWASSFLARRGTTTASLDVLAYKDMLNPCAPLVRATSGGYSMSKSQRRKQWLTGVSFFNEVRRSLLEWMPFSSSDGVAFVDLTPWDDKLSASVFQGSREQTAKQPAQMLVSPIWADMMTLDTSNKVI